MRLAGKSAIVTGAGSGIGRATAELFAREGAAVVAVDVAEEGVRVVADGIVRDGGRAAAVAADISDPTAVAALVEETVRLHGGVDVLVNAAGILATGDALETSLEQWRRVLDVNLTGAFLCAKAVLPHMLAAGGGSIVNFSSSTGAYVASRGAEAYVTSKSGVAMLTRALAVDFADRNVRVNAVSPGPVDTPMVRSRFSDEELASFGASLPVRRLGAPSEVAAAVLFLASDEASFVTGALLAVDGGQTAGVFTPADATERA